MTMFRNVLNDVVGAVPHQAVADGDKHRLCDANAVVVFTLRDNWGSRA